jgi:hypothetical protein
MMNWESSFSASEEKKLRDNDKPRGLLSSPATQEEPTSRFFFLVVEKEGLSCSYGFFLFFLFFS